MTTHCLLVDAIQGPAPNSVSGLILNVDVQERQRIRVAPLDALRECRNRLPEARLLGLECANVLVAPQIAPAKLVAFAEIDEQAAAHVRGLCHRHEIAQPYAVFGVEALSL